jgi:hypothetical protein
MSWFPGLLRRQRTKRQRTTVDQPFVIIDPTIGFFNLAGQGSSAIAESDLAALAPMFPRHQMSVRDVPTCDVLFLYCDLDERGAIRGDQKGVGQIIAAARAYLAVVASENSSESYQKLQFAVPGWTSNLVMALERHGESFPRFWRRRFEAMFAGQSMLTAWVALAPQYVGAQEHEALPATVMVANAGHITFAAPSR